MATNGQYLMSWYHALKPSETRDKLLEIAQLYVSTNNPKVVNDIDALIDMWLTEDPLIDIFVDAVWSTQV